MASGTRSPPARILHPTPGTNATIVWPCRAGQTPNDISGWTLNRAVEEQLALRKVPAPKSVRLENTCFNAVLDVFGEDKRLSKNTNLDLEQYQVPRLRMKKKKGQGPIQPSTVNPEVQYLAQLLRRAKLWSRLEDDYKPLRETKNGIGRAITEKQLLLKTAKDNPAWRMPFCAAVIAACSGGYRSIEIRKRRLGNIRLTKREAWITIPREATKTDAGVGKIPLNGPARWALERLLERARLAGASAPEHFLLPKDRSQHTRPDDPRKGSKGYDPTDHQSTWRTAWFNLCKTAGLQGLRFHDMRQLFITQAAEANVSLLVTESLVGHMSADMVRRYTHIRSHAKQNASLPCRQTHPLPHR